MGCKPYKSWEDWLKDHPEDSEESEEVDDDECADDETEMSVEGGRGHLLRLWPGRCSRQLQWTRVRCWRVHVTRGETASKTLHVQDEGDVDITLQDLCDEHETAVSVRGVEGTFCVSGVPCVARIRGECPEPQSNLLYGSYCAHQQPSGLFECLPCSSWEQWRAHNGIQEDDQNDEDDEEGDSDSSE
ncbi:hypothetical protein PINS_up023323 [Pythium insidiosum]|nr:hypothetical protein PINS_up023323 [Pythium insidiosum]